MSIAKAMLCGVFLTLSACSSLGTTARVEPASIGQYSTSKKICGENLKGAIDLDCFRFPEADGDVIASGKDGTVISGRLVKGTLSNPTLVGGKITAQVSGASFDNDGPAYDFAVTDMTARNRLAAILMTQSDAICVHDSAAIVANEAAINGILNILITGVSAAGTIVSGERAKTILAGVATAVSGSRDHVNAAVYRNQVSQAITASIAAERVRLKGVIDSHRNDPVATFTVDDMVRSVNEYHQACSFYKGLELALTSVAEYPKLKAFADRTQGEIDVGKLTSAIASQQKLIDELKKRADSLQGNQLALDSNRLAVQSAQADLTNLVQALHQARAKASGYGVPAPPPATP